MKKELILLAIALVAISYCGFMAGVGYEYSKLMNDTTVSEECTVDEALQRLARARESHRPLAENGSEFHIDCMESYDRIANLIRRLEQQ